MTLYVSKYSAYYHKSIRDSFLIQCNVYLKQNVDEKKRVTGSSGMSWENEMVSLVKKLSKDVKNSPNYKERKNQMLEERREYIKQEKMKRR